MVPTTCWQRLRLKLLRRPQKAPAPHLQAAHLDCTDARSVQPRYPEPDSFTHPANLTVPALPQPKLQANTCCGSMLQCTPPSIWHIRPAPAAVGGREDIHEGWAQLDAIKRQAVAQELQLRLANSIIAARERLVDGDHVLFVNGRLVLDQLPCDIAVSCQNEQATAICT